MRQQSMISAVSRQTSLRQESFVSRRRSSVRLGETLNRMPVEDKVSSASVYRLEDVRLTC